MKFTKKLLKMCKNLKQILGKIFKKILGFARKLKIIFTIIACPDT
ncbi:hypothetical protein LEP1GSC035_3667 [Leptospira noguchii str. 2007001578]|uniref:Uncharacterized protein n=1 Tax=Leptospira noguchii str. 2007001578 TaxID=1049974 RepID=A0ABN0J6H8_9LEPT|nr:hypothetical protein LEP1GSC035_3667 [Leptospira noguchii str. 2007001578]